MKKLIFTILIFAVCAALSAAEFRMDIQGVKGAALRPVSVSAGAAVAQSSWLGKRKDQRMSCTAAVTNDWKEFSFSFIPKNDGVYEINLMSDKKQNKVCCDEITVQGAEIKNGDFSQRDSKGGLAAWRKIGKATFTGENFAVSTHDDRWVQTIKCRKGEKITVTFKAKKF